MKFTLIAGIKKSPELKRLIDTVPREEIYSKKGMIRLKNTVVYCRQLDYWGGKMIVVYNPSLESVKRPHFYENSSDEKIARYLGFSLIFHNTSLSTADVVRKYFDKDTVERAFKQMKGVLDLRPVQGVAQVAHRVPHKDMLSLIHNTQLSRLHPQKERNQRTRGS